jgi:hypothetical protein
MHLVQLGAAAVPIPTHWPQLVAPAVFSALKVHFLQRMLIS